MRFSVFSSGSEGNCTLLRTAKLNILIDAGITKKQISENLERYGLTLQDIKLLFITHEHIDHVKSLPMLLKECQIKIYMSFGTYESLKRSYAKYGKEKVAMLLESRKENGSLVVIDRLFNSILYPSFVEEDLKVQVLPAFHDAAECIGFSFVSDEKKLVYITDTGYVHQDIYQEISNAEGYVLESNHDPEILMMSGRPYQLKVRILSDHGHMSNEDSMVTLCNVMGPNTKIVAHAHVSQECNLSEIIVRTRERVFDEYAVETNGVEFAILGPRFSGDFEV